MVITVGKIPYRFTIGQFKDGNVEYHSDLKDELNHGEYVIVFPLDDFNKYRHKNKLNAEILFEFLELVQNKSLYDVMITMKQLKTDLDESQELEFPELDSG